MIWHSFVPALGDQGGTCSHPGGARSSWGRYHFWFLSQAQASTSSSLLSAPKRGLLTLREVRVEMAVETQEPCGVLRLREPLHGDDVLLPCVSVRGVREADLVVQVADKPERFQVAVELLHLGERHLGQGLHHVAHRDIVRQAHPVANLDEPALAGQRPHLLTQRLAEAEASTTGGKPEGDPLLQEKSLR